MNPDYPSESQNDRSLRFLGVLLLIAVAGLGLRAWHLQTASFDHDEAYEIIYATTDLKELVSRHDGFPPFYRWLLGHTLDLTGSDRAARWFSAITGGVTIFLVGLLGRHVGGPKGGLMAATLLAVSASHLLISQHARAYSLFVLLAAWMMLAAWRLRRDDSCFAWFVFLLASWLAVATHYLAGLLLLLLGGMLLIEKRGAARRRALLAAAVLAFAGLLLVPGLQADLADSGEFFPHVGFDIEAYAFSYYWLVSGTTLGPSVNALREMETAQGIRAMLPWALAAAVPIVVLAIAAWRRLASCNRVWLLGLMLMPPLLNLLVAQWVPTGYNHHYIVWMVVPLVVVLGCGAALDRRHPGTSFATLALIGLGLFAFGNRHLDPQYATHDFDGVADLIRREQINPSTTPAVLAAPTYYAEAVLYAMPDDWVKQTATAHPDTEQDWDQSLPVFASKLGGRKEAWLVLQWQPEGHPRRAVEQRLAEKLNAELVGRVSTSVLVYRVAVESLR